MSIFAPQALSGEVEHGRAVLARGADAADVALDADRVRRAPALQVLMAREVLPEFKIELRPRDPSAAQVELDEARQGTIRLDCSANLEDLRQEPQIRIQAPTDLRLLRLSGAATTARSKAAERLAEQV